MNLNEFEKEILESSTEDWNVISCWGSGAAPSFLYSFVKWEQMGKEKENWGVDIDSHGMVASLKSNLSITMAWGLPCNSNFDEEWANNFPDPHARSSYIDFFYNGFLVYRDVLVSVDGGRASLPLPEAEWNKKDGKIVGLNKLTITSKQDTFFRMFNSLEKISEYERYKKVANILIEGEGWMT